MHYHHPRRTSPAGFFRVGIGQVDETLRAFKYRAWHRGTREADTIIGGFFDSHHAGWGEAERDWFADLLEETDVDIMAWAIGAQPVPERYQGAMMDELRRLDFIKVFK
ncbi:succinate dehydrogenase assembly factor 2 [Sphingomonas sp.]|uniref:succinate dehydrogenase assembly factor 2 n=1 Tax=Sphingomonas sp. TaxID=28214 RepID=UPI00325F953A